MQLQILMMFVSQLFSLITPEALKKFVDSGLNMLEDVITKSPNTYDDAIILPIIGMIRLTLGIPDQTDQNSVNNIVGATLDVKTQAISSLLTNLLKILPKDLMKSFINTGLDMIQDLVVASTNKIDDTIVLPIIKLIRVSFDIPEDASHLAIMAGRGNVAPVPVV